MEMTSIGKAMGPIVKKDPGNKQSKTTQNLLKDLRKLQGKIQQRDLQDAAELKAGENRTTIS